MVGAMSVQTGRRERKKAATRAALASAAMRLAMERGVEHVTAEAIAEAADVAPRTFHNYFSGKEEAILAILIDRVEGFADALRARPVGEPIWDSLQHAMVAKASGPPEELAELAAQMRMIKASRSLLVPQLAVFERVGGVFSAAIAERTGTDAERDLYPRLLAAVAAAALRTSLQLWLDGDGRVNLVEVTTDVLAQLRAGLPEPGAGP
jgi:AcrR family transcriptional regulator